MHVSNAVSPELLSHFFKMIADGAILESDIQKFCNSPQLWRMSEQGSFHAASATEFWQSVYDELLSAGVVSVPSVPTLTEKQVRSLDKFGFLLVYIPALTEDQYPVCFVKPAWGQYLAESAIPRKPLLGKWVAVETIVKPHYDDDVGYPNDRLIKAVKRDLRFAHVHGDLKWTVEKIAKITGFPKRATRLPTAEEWNFIGNLFNWLREHRSMNLPDLGSTRSWEWCENACDVGNRFIVGYSDGGGLAGVNCGWHNSRDVSIGLRVLAVL